MNIPIKPITTTTLLMMGGSLVSVRVLNMGCGYF